MRMKNWTRYILPILFTLGIGSVTAMEPLVKTTYVYAEGGESLRQLLEKKLRVSPAVLYQAGYYEKIRKWNAINNPNSLRRGQKIYIELPYRSGFSFGYAMQAPMPMQQAPLYYRQQPRYIDQQQYRQQPRYVEQQQYRQDQYYRQEQRQERTVASVEKESVRKLKKKRKKSKKKLLKSNKFNFSLFYTASFGLFQESIRGSDASTSSKQDSPFTLGLGTFKPLNADWAYSGSAYVSKFDGAVSDNNNSIEIPLEYGLTSYLNYSRRSWPVSAYLGLDYETFSIFNTAEMLQGEPIDVRSQTLGYFTWGLTRKQELFGKQFLFKLSYSTSFFSAISRQSSVSSEKFQGTKFILYANMKASKDWFYHTFYKQHDLKGPTLMHVKRIGVGFGFKF